MNLTLEGAEELKNRISLLQFKLAKSEENVQQLNKTCRSLMKAYMEEKKLYYQVLNNKYEKFLEECKVRRKRNEIILKSIHRIEDRTRILNLKTEKLKLLKDRYISYLKPLELKKPELNFSPPSKSLSTVVDKNYETQKIFQWKRFHVDSLINLHNRESTDTGIAKFLKYEGFDNSNITFNKNSFLENIKNKGDSNFKSVCNISITGPGTTKKVSKNIEQVNDFLSQEEKIQPLKTYENLKPMIQIYENIKIKDSFILGNSKVEDEDEQTHCSDKDILSTQKSGTLDLVKKEKCSDVEFGLFKKASELRSEGIIKHQNSIEKLKSAIFLEEPASEEGIKNFVAEKDETEGIEKDEKLGQEGIVKHQNSIEKLKSAIILEELVSEEKKNFLVEKDKIEANEKDKKMDSDFKSATDVNYNNLIAFNTNNNIECNSVDNNECIPKGMDGIDYENEIYPESYYEQPVHCHSNKSIASNVILEEDEFEEETDEVNQSLNKNKNILQSSFLPDITFSSETLNDLHLNKQDHNKIQDQKESQNFIIEKNLNIKTIDSPFVKSNKIEEGEPNIKNSFDKSQKTLLHLLESDSESFQIENGGIISANEDSDFDFSFTQN